MRKRLMFMAGAAVGYVLGAKAGRERYEQLSGAAQRFMGNPAVRNTMESAAQNGRQAAARAAGMVNERAGDRLPGPVVEKLRSVQGNRTPMDDDWGSSS
ncbi:YtxH domain-containing protein [Streptomyces sp. ACA25]|uniref:YtxH domain-containing protein n=1 Tax=Streptomyces sp. ACA25 TaxID=3022596 RepID=UPI00230802DD|nr:YtxH domain-containing protein [Streptomyces sp. ACA25]MDB1087716.1 YtxH domain-containing protein [Streptomyces sp. ACA25]